MNRLPVLALLLAAPMAAQFSGGTDDAPDTLLSRLRLAVQQYQEAHPDSRESVVLRRRGAITFMNMDGTNTLLAGDNLTRRDDNGNWVPAEPTLYTTRGGGWVRLGTETNLFIRNTAYGHMVEHRWRSQADRTLVYTFGIGIPQLTRVEGAESMDFTFTWAGAPWRLTLTDNGVSMRSDPISTRRGAVLHQSRLNWNNWTPGVNGDGDISGDAPFRLTRPVMVGADGSRTSCSAWTIRQAVINGQFTCDDSTLPDSALPYYIDPETATYTGNYVSSNGTAYTSPSGIVGWYYNGGPTSPAYETVIGFSTSLSGTINSAALTLTANKTGTAGLQFEGGYKNDAVISEPIAANNGTISTWFLSNPLSYTGDAFDPTTLALNTATAITLNNTGNINMSGQTAIRLFPSTRGTYTYMYEYYTISAATLSVTYTPAYAPTTVSVSGIPDNFHYGTWQSIAATVSDQNGYGDISYWHLLINYGVDGGWACYLQLFPNSNNLKLLNDVASDWGATYTLGAAQWATNSQCQVDLANSSFSNSGNTSTLNLRVQFLRNTLTRNPMNAYLWVTDATANSGWQGAYDTGYVRTKPKLFITNHQ